MDLCFYLRFLFLFYTEYLTCIYIAVGWSEIHIFLWAHKTWKLWQKLSYVITQWNLIQKTCVDWHLSSHRCYQTTRCQMLLPPIIFIWSMSIRLSLLCVPSSQWNQMRYVYACISTGVWSHFWFWFVLIFCFTDHLLVTIFKFCMSHMKTQKLIM